MTATAKQAVATQRPVSVILAAVLLGFLAVTATAGGLALSAGAAPPDEWLDDIPVLDTWLIPGLVLAVGFGIGSAVAAFGLWHRPNWSWLAWVERPTGHHWSWLATILIGAGQALWIGLELIYLPELSVLQAVYGPLGLALAILPFTSGMRAHLRIRS